MLLLFNGAAGLTGALVGAHLDSIFAGLAVFLGGSLTVTVLLALLVAGMAAWQSISQHAGRRRSATRHWRRGSGQ